MKWLIYFIILICVLSAAVSGICSPATLGVVSICLCVGAVFERHKIHLKWLNRILGIVMFFVLMFIHAMNVDSLHSMILGMFLNILWTVFCYRAISHEKTSDRIQVGVLAIVPLACVAFALEALELILFLTAYFIVLLIYFASLSMAEPTTGCVAVVQHQVRAEKIPQKQFWVSLTGAIFLAFFAGAVLFLTIPRYGAEAKSSVPGVEQGKGAFPDVELDKTGEIDLDPSLLFRAQVPDGEKTYYWRVDIQNRFDGTRWHSFVPTRAVNEYEDLIDEESANIETSYELMFVKEWRDFRIPTIEGTEFIAAHDDENNINFKFKREKSGMWRRYRWRHDNHLLKLRYWYTGKADSNAVYIPTPISDFYDHELRFDLSRHLASGFHPKYMWPFRRRERPLEKQMLALLDSILDGTENDRETADKIQAYLKKNYRYSLNRPVREGYVVMDFLFNQKFGHCEVFSTTMAVLLALKGVPVRNVTGFVSSETRDGMNMVRAAHAHSWVEAWIDNEWVRYDPTPSGAQTVELTWIRRIDDWFSTYQASDLYSWLIKYWQIIFAVLLMSAFVSVPVIVIRRKIKFLLSPTSLVYERAWDELTAACEEREMLRRYAKLSLGDWWESEHPEMREMESFVREYIRYRYAGNDIEERSIIARFKRNCTIVRRSRAALRHCRTILFDKEPKQTKK